MAAFWGALLHRRVRLDGIWIYMVNLLPFNNRRYLAVLFSAIAMLVAPFAYRVGVVFGLWQPVTRPPQVPNAAHYVSSIEDGTWFVCTLDSSRDLNFCKAWDPYGNVLADGEFRIECQGRAANLLELRPSRVSRSAGKTFAIFLYGADGSESGPTLVPVTSTVSEGID